MNDILILGFQNQCDVIYSDRVIKGHCVQAPCCTLHPMTLDPPLLAPMEIGHLEESNLQCYCGKVFSQQSALTNHTRNCKQSNKRLANALTTAKEAWEARKSRKKQKTGEQKPEQVIPTPRPRVVLKELEPSYPEVCL